MIFEIDSDILEPLFRDADSDADMKNEYEESCRESEPEYDHDPYRGPCHCNNNPCRCNNNPCRCNNNPCRCNNNPCRCNNDPCRCNNNPCRCNNDPCRCNDDPCREPRCRTKPVFLSAATGGLGPLSVITAPLAAPLPIVSLNLDPDEKCGLSVLLDFTTIINLPLAVIVSLNFQVLRSIDSGPAVAISPQFNFARTAAVLQSDSFGFQAFDSNVEGRTVTYFVVLATTSTITATLEILNPGVTILNATLSAFGV